LQIVRPVDFDPKRALTATVHSLRRRNADWFGSDGLCLGVRADEGAPQGNGSDDSRDSVRKLHRLVHPRFLHDWTDTAVHPMK